MGLLSSLDRSLLPLGIYPLLIIFTLLWLCLRLRQGSHHLGEGNRNSSVPRLQGRVLLFGLDILWQDIQDFRTNKSSNRAVLRHRCLGATYISTILGRSTVHTIDAANIEAVTADNFADYEKGDWAQTIAQYMGKGILVNDDEEWHASRHLLRPLLRRKRGADVRMFKDHVDRLIEYLRKNSSGFIDFRKSFQMVILDIITEMLCGQSTMSISKCLMKTDWQASEPDLLNLIDDMEPYGKTAIELGPLSLPVFVLYYREIMNLIRGIQHFFQKAVSDARSSDAGAKKSFVHHFLASEAYGTNVQGELQNVFFAAFDTTSTLLTNLFDSATRDSRVLQHLRAEIDNIHSDGKPVSETTLPSLTYLRATILETLRLHSPVTYHTRKARVDTVLPHGAVSEGQSKALIIGKGTSVTWSTYALNRQPNVYGSDVDEFNPGRWLQKMDEETNRTIDNGETLHRLISRESFIPFGSGPRNCLGQQLAMLLTSYVAARVFAEFDTFELENRDRPFCEAAAVIYYNSNGTRIRLRSHGSQPA